MYSPLEEKEFYSKAKSWLKTSPDKSEIEALREVIRYLEWRYYINNDPVVGDTEYDLLYKSLEKLEQANPLLITEDSPTQRVAQDLTGDLPSVTHRIPMLSLDNSYDEVDLLKFDEQIHKLTGLAIDKEITYTVEPKLDGGSVALLYENDLFIRGATRGNGIQGEDITPNMRTLPSVPLKAAFHKYGIHAAELRGEAVIKKTYFQSNNLERELNGLSTFANPRNAAAGGLRTKNPNETRDRGIEFFGFQLGYAADKNGNNVLDRFPTHTDQLSLLSNLGFRTYNSPALRCQGIQEVLKIVKKWSIERDNYLFEIDGLVIKVDRVDLQDVCGSTQHHPRWAIAYKFKAKQASTQLLNIEYQVGKIGSITPVAKVEPVHLAGVTVSSISLHNEEFIKSKDIRIGDQLIIERAGDVIPYVVKSISEVRNGTEEIVNFPSFCPIDPDHTVALIKEESESAWRCPNCICGAQDLQRIIFHVSKDGMDIDGFGKSYVERFYELGWIKDISDIYALDYQAISALEGFGTKSAAKIQTSIEKAKDNPIHRLLASLTIHHLGKKASKIIAAQIDHVLELRNWKEEDFLNLKDIGPVVAKNVIDYFSMEKNIKMLQIMEERGVNLTQTPEDKPKVISSDAPLANKSILFTGTLSKMGRDEAKKMAEDAGAKSLSAVSSKLDILVVGENAGSKLKKAEALGTITIMTEDEFLALIQ